MLLARNPAREALGIVLLSRVVSKLPYSVLE